MELETFEVFNNWKIRAIEIDFSEYRLDLNYINEFN